MTATVNDKAATLFQLHRAPEVLQLINVWDVISAQVIADLPATTALATAGHSIAATYGYADGAMSLDLMLEAVARIVACTALPVSADLEAGFENPGETVRRAIGVGVVGANIEDRMCPLAEAVQRMSDVVVAGHAEGVDFVLNARTDAMIRGTDRDLSERVADAIERGTAYLEVGATTVFVPGVLGEDTVVALVDAFGHNRLSVIALPGSLSPVRLHELGVARISYGPWMMNVALTALADTATALQGGGSLPAGTRVLN